MTIPGSANPLLLKSAAAAGPVQIERSLRFNSSDSAYLSRTPASAGNRQNWTWSGWVKRSNPDTGVRQVLFSAYGASNDTGFFEFGFDNGSNLNKFYWTQWSVDAQSAAVFRDFSAWCHILVNYNGSNIVVYVNGTSVLTSAKTGDLAINGTFEHGIGRQPNSGRYFSGYIADIYFIDGQALTPSSFTEVSATTGQLIPKAYTGTFTGNSFWLKFADNSAATATTLGKDSSGLGNNWTPNNLSVLTGNFNIANASLTPPSSGFLSGRDLKIYAFDGDTSNYLLANSSNDNYSVNFSPAISVNSSVEIYGLTSGQQASTNLSSAVTYTSGTFTTIFSGSGSLTQITMIAVGNRPALARIRVDGVELISTLYASGNDSLVDTPTSYGTDTGAGGEVRGNYATLNPLNNAGASGTYSNGNLEITTGSSQYGAYVSTIATPTSGKWYAEAYITSGANTRFGFVKASYTPSSTEQLGNVAGTMAYRCDNGDFRVALTTKFTGGATCTSGDTVGLALDNDNGEVKIYKNGSLQGTATGIEAANWCFAGSDDNGAGTASHIWNFGQRPFAYTAPSGFKALCDTNLPAPVVAKPNTVMDVKLDTGANILTAAQGALSGGADLLWIKDRANANNHQLIDTVRGGTATLQSNTTSAETTYSAPSGSSVAWCWDAGTSTVTNTQGSITSQVRANASAGFSIVTWNGNGNATIGHGLGVAPQLIICKKRDGVADWQTGHASIGWTKRLALNLTTAEETTVSAWNNTAPTSTVFSVGNTSNFGGSMVSYCFAPVSGYSSFGSYTGNGSADGPFVYTGFRPRWILIKQTNTAGNNWTLIDSARNTYNVVDEWLSPDISGATYTFSTGDFLSNGFKLRNTGTGTNANGGTYIYAAFAENPFQFSRAR